MALSGRRFSEMAGMRRQLRTSAGSSAKDPYVALFGANLIEMWDSQLGIATVSGNADTWTGQLGGRVLPAPSAAQRPAYGADGTKFSGKNVVQCATSGTKVLWANNTLSGLALAGTQPVVIARFRLRTAAGTQRIVGFGAPGARSIEELSFSGSFRGGDITTTTVSTGVASDTAVHTMATFSNATVFDARLDGVDHNGAASITLQANATYGGVGVFAPDGASSPADLSIAKILFLAADPGGAALTACEALLSAEYAP